MKIQLLGCAYLVLPLLSALALAQEEESGNKSEWLDEVRVTAQKREQGLSELPLSITAFSGDQLDDLGVLNVRDLAENTPGLVVTGTAEGEQPNYFIRGVGFADDWALTSGTVSVNIDEVPFAYSIFTQGQVFDIERVEVLRGPQGDLYGKNTTAGTINFVSAKPTDAFASSITLGYGRFDTIRSDGFVSGPLSETLRGRFAWQTTNRNEAWQQNWVTGEKLGKSKIANGRILLDWAPTDNFDMLFNYHSYSDDSDNTGPVNRSNGTSAGSDYESPLGSLPPPLAGRESLPSDSPFRYSYRDTSWEDGASLAAHQTYLAAAMGITVAEAAAWLGDFSYDHKPTRNNKGHGASLRANYDFGGITLSSITAWEQMDRRSNSNGDGSVYSDWAFNLTTDVEQISQEVRLTSANSDTLTWIVGLYFSNDTMSEEYDNDYIDWVSDATTLPFFFTTRYTQESDTAAIFGHAEYSFTDRLTLITGLRSTKEKREIYDAGIFSDSDYDPAYVPWLENGALITGNWIGDPTVPEDIPDSFEQTEPSWKVGLDYQFTDSFRGYVSVSEGWKSGGYNGGNLVVDYAIGPYRPEVLRSYEAGIKAFWEEANFRVNASVYSYDYKDRQTGSSLYNQVVTSAEGVDNMAEVDMDGWEVEAVWAPLEGLTLVAGFAGTDGKIITFEQWDSGLAGDMGYICDNNGDPTPNDDGGNLCNVRITRDGDKLNHPDLQFNGLIQFEHDLSSSLIGRIALNHTFQKAFDTLDTANGSYPIQDRSLTRLNASLIDSDGAWEVRAWADNIFDEEYYISAGGANSMSSTTWPLPPQWGLDFTLNFGN